MNMDSMMGDVKEVLITTSDIQDKVREIGDRVTEDYEAKNRSS